MTPRTTQRIPTGLLGIPPDPVGVKPRAMGVLGPPPSQKPFVEDVFALISKEKLER